AQSPVDPDQLLSFALPVVDGMPEFVVDEVSQNPHTASARVDLGYADVGAVGTGHMIDVELVARRQACRFLRAQPSTARLSSRPDLGERQRFRRNTSYLHRAIGQLDIIDGNLEHLCSQFHEPQCDFFAGTADRVTRYYRGSAGPGPSSVRLQQSVPIDDVYGIDLDCELVGDDLGQDGFDSLAQRGPSGVDSHPPPVGDLDVGRVMGA